MRTQLKLAAAAFAAICLLHGPAMSGEAQQNFWLKAPVQGDVNAVYPPSAMAANVSGRATLSCNLTAQGLLADCTVEDETPKGYNFGAAAMNLVTLYQSRPQPAARRITVPMSFTTRGPDMAEAFKADLRARGWNVEELVRDLEWNNATRMTELRDRGLDPEQMKQILGIQPTRAQATMRLWSAPNWIATPSWADIQAGYPRMANAAEGVATIQCEVQPDGFLRACQVLNETPRNNGIGSAALNLSKKFQTRLPEVAPGQPASGLAVQIAIRMSRNPPATPPLITQPAWTMGPSAAAVAAAFPDQARSRGLTGGTGAMVCTVGDGGRLTGCTAAGENPTGSGFAAAALRLSELYRISPWTSGVGPSAGARVNVPVRFGAP